MYVSPTHKFSQERLTSSKKMGETTLPCNLVFEGLVEGVVGVCPTQFHESAPNWNKGVKEESVETESEPTSVLDNNTSSPSPPNSASTLSSNSFNGGGAGFGMGDLEGFSFAEQGSLLLPPPLFLGEIEDPSFSFKHLLQPPNPLGFAVNDGIEAALQNSGMSNFNLVGSFSSDSGSICNVGNDSVNEEQFRVCDVKPEVLNPQFGLCDQNTTTIHNSGCYNVGNDVYPSVVQMQQQWLMGLAPPPQFTLDHLVKQPNSEALALRDQLVKIAEMFQTGNLSLAQVILARLNHQLSLPLSGKPLVRAATFHVKEELEKLLTMMNSTKTKTLSVLDVINKMNAYKLFSEASPVVQFVDFTRTQALLEALDDADYVHILDFDIGCGSQWASFIRELPLRKRGAPFLRLTVFASSSTHHPFELALVCDNVMEFAKECGVSIDIQVMNLDLFDAATCTMPDFHPAKNETVAVNFPIWACSDRPFLLSQLLAFIKQCSPKIMVTFDRGCDHFESSFPSQILQALDSCSNLLESIPHGSTPDISNKIGKFFIEPIIERAIVGRIHSPDKMQPNKAHQWKNLFTCAGFFPLPFSNVTESQANLVIKRTPMRGFQVEKQQASLVLSWTSRELVAASAWRC